MLLDLDLGVPTKLSLVAENKGTVLAHAVASDHFKKIRMLFR